MKAFRALWLIMIALQAIVAAPSRSEAASAAEINVDAPMRHCIVLSAKAAALKSLAIRQREFWCFPRQNGGEGGIRTHGTDNRTTAFDSCWLVPSSS
jgi:hypothetical protein